MMSRKDQNIVLGAVISMTYSLYSVEMTEERSALVRRALRLMNTDAAQEEIDALLFDLHQSKYDLNPGCQCFFGHGYYPEDFTDNFRKLDRQDEVGQAARELFEVLLHPKETWSAELMYSGIRAIYNKEYDDVRIRKIQAELEA